MVTKEEIVSYFEELNIEADPEVLNKSLELCAKYNIGAEDFCDQWYAYTASNLNGEPPTIEHLEKLERKEFQKTKDKQSLSTPKRAYVPHDLDESNLADYSPTTPKSIKKQTPHTPVQIPSTPKTPAAKNISKEYGSESPSLSITYSQRSDSQAVQSSYGAATAQFKREGNYPVSVKYLGDNSMQTDFKYMYEIMGKKARCLNDMTQYLGHAILEHNGLTLSEEPLKAHLGETITYGRIVSDCDGKINAQSVLLEGTRETNMHHTTTLNLSKVSKYSLFPGQVVGVQGNNVSATALIADKIYHDAPLKLPEEPPVTSESMQIVVACGPFTLQDNLSYEPLHDLLTYVTEHEPNVLILLGPFIERTHDSVRNGLNQTFDSFFEGLIENIMNSLQNSDIHVVMVASLKDAHHHPVYPTPPYIIREQYSKLTFVSDPCVIDVNGLVIGATTADVLFHIGSFELYYNKNATGLVDRMSRISSHILNQHSFYPLYPPNEEMCIDHELLEQFGMLDTKPHILIIPSNLRNFVKNVNECLVINPERLTKGFVAGTFARIEISPGNNKSICNRTSCQILRI